MRLTVDSSSFQSVNRANQAQKYCLFVCKFNCVSEEHGADISNVGTGHLDDSSLRQLIENPSRLGALLQLMMRSEQRGGHRRRGGRLRLHLHVHRPYSAGANQLLHRRHYRWSVRELCRRLRSRERKPGQQSRSVERETEDEKLRILVSSLDYIEEETGEK